MLLQVESHRIPIGYPRRKAGNPASNVPGAYPPRVEKSLFPVAKRVWALTIAKDKRKVEDPVVPVSVAFWFGALPQKNPDRLPVHWGMDELSMKKPFDPVSKKAKEVLPPDEG